MISNESLKWVYKNLFLSQKIRDKYLKKFNNYKILGQNFVNTVFIMIIEVKNNKCSNKNIFYVIEENSKNSKIFELKTFTARDKYIRFNQNSLKNLISKKVFKTMVKNGLFKSKKERTYNAQVSIQRLIGCLYDDITGMDMHHINKDKTDNRFANLVPLDGETNKKIDSLPLKEMIHFGEEKHNKWVKTINKQPRKTLSKNPLLVIEILSNSLNKTAIQLQKQFKKKIKSIKVIREIRNTYFYEEEFLKFIKTNNINIYSN